MAVKKAVLKIGKANNLSVYRLQMGLSLWLVFPLGLARAHYPTDRASRSVSCWFVIEICSSVKVFKLAGCGDGSGMLMETWSGVIKSENFPHSHSGNGDCIWNIRAPTQQRGEGNSTIEFEFDTFVTSSQRDRMYVFVRDAHHTRLHGSLVFVLCCFTDFVLCL